MSHNNDNSGMLYFGGIAVIVIMLGFLIKILKEIMIELSLLFAAIAKMASSFMTMAWQIALVLGLLSLGVLAIYAAWIFSKKYYQLVKNATEVKEQIESRFLELHTEFEDSFKRLHQNASREINQMRKELDEALKRSDVVPTGSASSVAASDAANTSAEATTTQSANELAGSINAQVNNEPKVQSTTQIQDTPKDISNPF